MSQLNNTVMLLLSTSYGQDREGERYIKALVPDMRIDEPDSFNNIPGDKKVLTAMKWIRSKR